LHTLYKALAPEDVELIIAYCRDHTIQNGGLFEVYPDPDRSVTTVVVNSRHENEPLENFRPVGAFFCNYFGPGIISLEEEDLHYDGMASAKNHIKDIKKNIDTLISTIRSGSH
jgi:hypothetical protein